MKTEKKKHNNNAGRQHPPPLPLEALPVAPRTGTTQWPAEEEAHLLRRYQTRRQV